MFQKIGFLAGVLLMAGIVAPPIAMLWWPLILHHLWWEIYRGLWAGSFDVAFWHEVFVTVTVQILLPYWFVKLVVFTALRRHLRAWGNGVRLLYLVASASAFCGFVAWQGTLQFGPRFQHIFWIAWVLLSAWLSPFRIIWSAILKGGDPIAYPPRWVGEVMDDSWRFRLWQGFIGGVLRVGAYLTGEEKTTDSNVFGAAPHPSGFDMEKAGLV